MVLVDSNVLIDIFTDDPRWQGWSAERLGEAVEHDDLAINPVIYAELAAGFERPAQLERTLAHWPLTRLPLPYEAAFAAGHAFLAYRRYFPKLRLLAP
jgi:predicted nucleic acid-binding protein